MKYTTLEDNHLLQYTLCLSDLLTPMHSTSSGLQTEEGIHHCPEPYGEHMQ